MKKKPRLEKEVVADIREYLVNELGATCHKMHGSVFTEAGHADLYGTLPGGRAYYFEVKRPGREKQATPAQEAFLKREQKRGALVAIVASAEAVISHLRSEGIRP